MSRRRDRVAPMTPDKRPSVPHDWRRKLSDGTIRSYIIGRHARVIYDRERTAREVRLLAGRWSLTLRRVDAR